MGYLQEVDGHLTASTIVQRVHDGNNVGQLGHPENIVVFVDRKSQQLRQLSSYRTVGFDPGKNCYCEDSRNQLRQKAGQTNFLFKEE